MTSNVDGLIREHFGLSENEPINAAVRDLHHITAETSDKEQQLRNINIDPEFFTEYGIQFAKGIQWVQRQFPECEGPQRAFIGKQGQKIAQHLDHVRIGPRNRFFFFKNTGESGVMISFESITKRQKQKNNKQTTAPEDESRKHLANQTWDEAVFLSGVEEAYHIIQNQDPEILDRIEKQEAELRDHMGPRAEQYIDGGREHKADGIYDVPSDVHDVDPRELDVVPMLEKALEEYRGESQQKEVSITEHQDQIVDKLIREKLGLAKETPLQPAVRHVMRSAMDKGGTGSLQDAIRMDIKKNDFEELCPLIARGIQWVHKKFPEQEGPRLVLFANRGTVVSLGDERIQMQDTVSLARNKHSTKALITWPLQDIKEALQMRAESAPFEFTSKQRTELLGQMTYDEYIFVVAVEEAYHAIQHQNQEIRTRLENAEQHNHINTIDAIFAGDSIDEDVDDHDVNPRELDANPILKEALDYYRANLKGRTQGQ